VASAKGKFMTVALREVNESDDWQVFAGWLNQPHVLASWGQPADIIAELQQHPRTDMRVITLNKVPIGLAARKSNQAAIRSFTKVGCSPFRDFTEDGKPYTYFILDLHKV
jgi:hypothetical protein